MKIPKGYEHFGHIEGSFDSIPEDAKERVQAIVKQFTVNNGFRHRDGSVGFVKISPKHLQDLLVWFTNGMIEQYLAFMPEKDEDVEG